MRRLLATTMIAGVAFAGLAVPGFAVAQTITDNLPRGFENGRSPLSGQGTVVPKLMDSYRDLIENHPDVMIQNYNYVIDATRNATPEQVLRAVRDDRANKPYNALDGLGPLTNSYLKGSGGSATNVAPQSMTETTFAGATMADYEADINYLNQARSGFATFGDGTPTPLASALDFISNTARWNASTEPSKRTFARWQEDGSPNHPLDAAYGDYNATTADGRTKLTAEKTSTIDVPGYLAAFDRPAVYADDAEWVRGFTVTQERIDANGGAPITVPHVGVYDAAGNFTPAEFNAGDYAPGIGAAPRPYRIENDVVVPQVLEKIINARNPYSDGAMPSGHTNEAFMETIAMSFLVPERGQEVLTRGAEMGESRIFAGMHSPLDVIGGRIQSTAIVATNIYDALYDENGARVDWTDPSNADAYKVYKAYSDTQNWLASDCGAASVGDCLKTADTSGDRFADKDANRANYLRQMTYGFEPIGEVKAMTDEEVPLAAQVLLMNRFAYMSDEQRTSVLASTALPSGYPLLSGNAWDGWGQLNLVAAHDGFGALNKTQIIDMDASLGGYAADDTWSNDIGGEGGLVKRGDGVLRLAGQNTYTGGTTVEESLLVLDGSVTGAVKVAKDGALGGSGSIFGDLLVDGLLTPGTSAGHLDIDGDLSLTSTSTLKLEFGGLGLGEFDSLKVGGDLFLADALLDVSLIEGFNFSLGDAVVFMILDGARTGMFAGLAEGGMFSLGNQTMRFSYAMGDGNDIGFYVDGVAPVPLPATAWLMMAAFGAMGYGARRRARA